MKGLSPYFSKDSFEIGIENRGTYFAFDEIKHVGHSEQLILRSELLGSRNIYIMPLIDGVSFCYCHINTKDKVAVIQNPNPQRMVTLSFLIDGYLNYDIQPNAKHEIKNGFAYIDAPEDRNYNLIKPNLNVLSVDFHFEEALFLNYLREIMECHTIPATYQSLCLSLHPSTAPQVPFSKEMHLLFLQILNCPFQGNKRVMYFESKITEVLILYFHELQKVIGNQKNTTVIIHQADKNKLFFLKEYLKDKALSPLSLSKLSMMIGMSETAMQIKFKKLFLVFRLCNITAR